jgi:4-hydroxy-tetrahydrodipicolinate reductase
VLRQADVVIEFSRPEAAFENVMACLEAGVAVVSGTTGWAEQLKTAENYCSKAHGSMLWASNFSVGVNLFFELNRYLAQLMHSWPDYQPSLVETHHIHKLDAPSGTAISLLNDICHQSPQYTGYQLIEHDASPGVSSGKVPVTALRIGEVPGTHQVSWQSEIDAISIEHRADSRAGFAKGALLAAKWLHRKQGVFSMKDVLNINNREL